MSSYLVVKNSTNTLSYPCKTTHTGSPYLKVDTGYLDLTTETATGTYVVVKSGESNYRPKRTTSGTQNTKYKETLGYRIYARNVTYISDTTSSYYTTGLAVSTNSSTGTTLSSSGTFYDFGDTHIPIQDWGNYAITMTSYLQDFTTFSNMRLITSYGTSYSGLTSSFSSTNVAIYTDMSVINSNKTWSVPSIYNMKTFITQNETATTLSQTYTYSSRTSQIRVIIPLDMASVVWSSTQAVYIAASHEPVSSISLSYSAWNDSLVSTAFSYKKSFVQGEYLTTTETLQTTYGELFYLNSRRGAFITTSTTYSPGQYTLWYTVTSTRESTYTTEI